MIKYNDNNFIAGYIKQILNSINLPDAKVLTWTTKNLKYPYDIYKNKIFIKDNKLMRSVYGDKLEEFDKYIYNRPYLNITHKYSIKSLRYDSETHKTLGEYLRFIRDYHEVDLMSLYNCFSNELAYNLYIKNSEFEFNSDSKDYKIYKVPVKFGKEYTIAIDSASGYELLVGFNNGYPYSVDGVNNYISYSYMKINSGSFRNPAWYDRLRTVEILNNKFVDNERDLVLYIKLPIDNDSSIVVLEGNYSCYNDYVIEGDTKLKNYTTVNFDADLNIENIPLISSCQLLWMNSHVSYPFADKLIEYLCGNVVCSLDKVDYNIEGLQRMFLSEQYIDTINQYGIWTDDLRYKTYSLLQQKGVLNEHDDMLGYFDKDAENEFKDIDSYKVVNGYHIWRS